MIADDVLASARAQPDRIEGRREEIRRLEDPQQLAGLRCQDAGDQQRSGGAVFDIRPAARDLVQNSHGQAAAGLWSLALPTSLAPLALPLGFDAEPH